MTLSSSRGGGPSVEPALRGHGPSTGSASLVVTRGPNAGSQLVLAKAVNTIGRHPDSDVFLDDATVSRRHAEIWLGEDEIQVVDVGSLNGTYVNRDPVGSATLAAGDEVGFGNFRLVLLVGETCP